jgi:hypothetical protein
VWDLKREQGYPPKQVTHRGLVWADTSEQEIHESLRSGAEGIIDVQLEKMIDQGFIVSLGSQVGGSGVRYGALAVESGGAGPKEGPLEV